MIFLIKPIKKALISRRKYLIILTACWIYTFIWITALILIWYFWNVPVLYKLLVNGILILGTPAITDLTKSYEKYKEELGKQLERKTTGSTQHTDVQS